MKFPHFAASRLALLSLGLSLGGCTLHYQSPEERACRRQCQGDNDRCQTDARSGDGLQHCDRVAKGCLQGCER